MANKNTNTILCSFTIFFSIVTDFPAITFATTYVTDLKALLDIKKHVQSDHFQVLNSWNDSIHFCNWQGITCGNKHKRVTILNISSLDLGGTLSPSVGNLTFLQKIYLNGNSFHGMIPPEIGKLFRLRHLNFESNLFQGQIPANLSWCKNIQSIYLFGNNLNGRIPNQLSALSNLITLALGTNNFTGNIPPSLGNISTLVNIDLSCNNLTGNVPRELGKLFNLRYLSLSSNKLSGIFPVEIYNISSIQDLSISYNYLRGQFSDGMGLTLPYMVNFYAGLNNFSGSIPSTLANASNLEEIDIGYNLLTGPIPQNLDRLHKLVVLQFNNNPLGIDRGNDISFITTLINCTDLVQLSSGGIEIGGVLPMEVSNLSRKLTHFSLYHNHISGHLPEGIGELVGLIHFDVLDNDLSGNIPVSIGKLRNLNNLHLYQNNFIGKILSSIGDISGLLILDLGINMLTGSIPLSMRNLTELKGLRLDGNQLNGSIPKELFSKNSPLLVLYLDRNKFTGSLPLEVGNLKNLIALTLSENELSDEIPISIGDCQMLNDFEVEGNFLNGTIPSTLGQLINMEFMDLSRNNLSGEIPKSLEKLKYITFLNLSFNMLEGEVPINGVFLNTSALSIIGNGKLCGGDKSLNLPVCPTKSSKKHEKLSTHIIIILSICFLLALVLLFGCAYAIYQKRKPKVVLSSTSLYDKRLLKISYAEILASTNGFSSENLVGEGKYGFVYRGILKPSKKVIAIKVLKLHLKGAHKSFLAECEALRNIRHKNLIKIITSCSSIDFKGNDFKALILEYVPNGSLEEWLHQNTFVQNNEKNLDFLERLNIAIDIATALDYLHNYSGNPIIHCDIKPSNVLLGDDLRGMVSDFGLAKFLHVANDISHDTKSTSIGIRGTIGYVAPEYGMGSDISTKADIYSYGILLLEMFTGKRSTDTMFIEDFSLHNYAKTALDHHVAEIIDPRLFTIENSKYSSIKIESSCISIFHVGFSCSSVMQNERMAMNDALIQLRHVRNEL